MRMHYSAHPGKILGNYLAGRSVTEVARHLGVTRPTLSRVLNGRAGISADMALRLAATFDTEADFWLHLRMQRDLWETSQKERTKVKPLPVGNAG
ncbi:MAG TPA: HigA family addiction module antitoxin [Acidobacteriaceae bacterium]|nr:HigA family addiction module antitoxin [Acidobacteriaceae bacterium]